MTILHYACKMHNLHHHTFHCIVKASIFVLYRQASPLTSGVEEVSTDPLESLKAVSHWKRLQPKFHNLFRAVENSVEQCFAAKVVQCCQQYCSGLLNLN